MILLPSCKEVSTAAPSPRPVKLSKVSEVGQMKRSYSGIVSPAQFSDLAFKSSGMIVRMDVLEGQRVKKNDVLAELDASMLRLDYEAAQASFLQARSSLQRAEKLLEKNAISVQEYESTKARFVNARSVYENASDNLENTRLRAPFDGFVQKKYVENYQRVQPGQGVLCLINPDKLQIVFTLPDNHLVYITSPHTLQVEFDAYKGHLFDAQVKEYVEASPDGAGVPVYLSINDSRFDLQTYQIAVGFSCRVILDTRLESHAEGFAVPLSAVVYDNQTGGKAVFVYQPSTHSVEQRNISDDGIVIGQNMLMVTGGVHADEQVVSAGASYLEDGQVVSVLNE